jgi:hypothetical protein
VRPGATTGSRDLAPKDRTGNGGESTWTVVVPVLLGGWWRSRRVALGWCSPLSPRRCPTAGCAGLQQPEVERVAAAFTQSPAVDRCALLAPATVAALEHDESAPCADALGQLDLPGGQLVSSAVWGENALVRFDR